MNIEYAEESDISELIKKIDNNYQECKKYDVYIKEESIEEELYDKNFKEKNNLKNLKTNNFNTYSGGKSEIKKNEINNIKNIIFQKKIHEDKNKKHKNFKKDNNKIVITNINVRKKRIVESSDESDENEYLSSVKKIADYIQKRKNQRKK